MMPTRPPVRLGQEKGSVSCDNCRDDGTDLGTSVQGHQGDPCFPGQATDTAGDKCSVLFVPADDCLDLRVRQRIEHFVNLRTRNAKDIFAQRPADNVQLTCRFVRSFLSLIF